ncbi:hypothetical protein NLI96_g12692 [Meripilus lineatus]|uniref:Uncharacterized protein n=1 Tax=Meripilus lineatus TaxID=2056292 RepID=A0AAD5UPC7_9APHY|nr:hypothetical protein NLI96_g12692 [Physisporinus lineatus]
MRNEITTQDIVNELEVRVFMMLLDYVRDPELLLDLLDNTDSVISGSFVNRFIEGAGNWVEGDMDIYVNILSAHLLLEFLRSQGYRVTSPARNRERYGRRGGGIEEVIKMQKENPTRRVDIIVSSNKSSTYPIAHFWATHIMNFLMGSKICIVYPATMEKVGFVMPSRMQEWRVRILMGKYEHRGYVFPEMERAMLGEVRYFGNEQCWILPIKRVRRKIMGGRISNVVIWKF